MLIVYRIAFSAALKQQPATPLTFRSNNKWNIRIAFLAVYVLCTHSTKHPYAVWILVLSIQQIDNIIPVSNRYLIYLYENFSSFPIRFRFESTQIIVWAHGLAFSEWEGVARHRRNENKNIIRLKAIFSFRSNSRQKKKKQQNPKRNAKRAAR